MKAKEFILGSLALCLTAVALADYLTLGQSGDSDGTSGYSGTLMKLNVGEYSYEEPVSVDENGYAGEERAITRTVYMGITGINWSEEGDKPCEITAYSRSLEPTIGKAGSRSKKICSGGTGNRKTVKFSAARYFLRGIAVCTTDKKASSNNRLKGIRIYPAEVSANGSVKDLDTYEEARHARCERWFQPVYCPGGYIASGLKLYHNGDAFGGLGLKCREVTLAISPYKP